MDARPSPPSQSSVLPANRLGASLATSLLLHGLALGVMLAVLRPPVRPALVVIPVSLVGRIGGGEGAPGGDPAPAASQPVPPVREPALVPAPPVARPVPARRAVAHPTPEPELAAVAPAAGEDVAGTGDAGGGGPGGGGGGAGDGDGSGGARAAYGTNPLPPYPLVARRLGKEGVVVLDVLVAPDGRAADVRIVQSCGFAPLDDSAATTVRERWRFVPARRGTTPVESRVTVPIRFRLDDARG